MGCEYAPLHAQYELLAGKSHAPTSRKVLDVQSNPLASRMNLVGPMVAPQTGPEGAKAFLCGIYRTLFWARFGRLQQFSAATSVPTGVVAWPRRGNPGVAGVWWGNMCAVVGAVGRMAGAHYGKDAHRNVWAPSGPV